MKESNIRYIVVVFYQGVGYTLQTDDKPHIFFHHPALVYKKLGHAKNKADKMTAAYLHDKVCVCLKLNLMRIYLVTNIITGVRMRID